MNEVDQEEQRPDPSFFIHNLRNYVGTVMTNADRLKADRNDERALQLIAKAAALALRDLQAFTDLARPIDLKPERVELGAWLKGVVEGHPSSRKLKCQQDSDGKDVVAHIDKASLAEAVDLVLTNSAEAMPEGGAIVYGARACASGCGFWIEDKGGAKVRDVTLEMIGAPFFTLKANRVGLGLSRARHILQQHGGRLELAPAPAGGLRVQFVLPPSSPI